MLLYTPAALKYSNSSFKRFKIGTLSHWVSLFQKVSRLLIWTFIVSMGCVEYQKTFLKQV